MNDAGFWLGIVISGLGIWQFCKWCEQASPEVKDAAAGGVARMIDRFFK